MKNLDYIEEPTPKDLDDMKSIETIVNAINTEHTFKGDGKYRRLVNYLNAVCETIVYMKRYWKDDDSTLTAFMLGIECACVAISKHARQIDITAYKRQLDDWRRI